MRPRLRRPPHAPHSFSPVSHHLSTCFARATPPPCFANAARQCNEERREGLAACLLASVSLGPLARSPRALLYALVSVPSSSPSPRLRRRFAPLSLSPLAHLCGQHAKIFPTMPSMLSRPPPRALHRPIHNQRSEPGLSSLPSFLPRSSPHHHALHRHLQSYHPISARRPTAHRSHLSPPPTLLLLAVREFTRESSQVKSTKSRRAGALLWPPPLPLRQALVLPAGSLLALCASFGPMTSTVPLTQRLKQLIRRGTFI